MKNYLVEILFCGEDFPMHTIIEAKNKNDLYKKVNVLYFMGYDDVDEYEEDEGQPYTNLDAQECLDDMLSCEDILLYIMELESQKVIFDYSED